MSLSTQTGQRGLRAAQTWRPWRMSRSPSAVHSPAGTIEQTSVSISTGSVDEVSFNLPVSRVTWVSTAKPGFPKATPSTTLAVLRPTPRRVTRSSIRSGTRPPKRATTSSLMAMMARALAWKKPVLRISSSSSAGSASARATASG